MSDISQKTQKLSSAVYFLTSFFDDKEPLKWKLRTLAIDLVSEIARDKHTLAREILALFTMAKTVRLISDTNYGIISEELSKFEKDGENPFNRPFLPEERDLDKTLSQPVKTEVIKDKITQSEERPLRREMFTEVIHKPLKEFGAWSRPSIKKNSRQSTIINLLKRKKEITIKDVSALITGCSEKTIQRELLSMVTAGLLRKVGEKRWSRYSLAGNV